MDILLILFDRVNTLRGVSTCHYAAELENI